jgi:uncharacterized membrane protein
MMVASDRLGEQARRAGVDVVSIQIDKLQVVIAREEPTGCRVAHACTIGTNRVQIERRYSIRPALGRTCLADGGGTVAARMDLVRTE